MNFLTDVKIEKSNYQIAHTDGIMMLGSCFAQNMGLRLQECKFRVELNPFGILYNPLSICEALNYILKPEAFLSDEDIFFYHNELWHSIMHHGDFSRRSREEAVEATTSRLLTAAEALASTDTLILTLGTAYVYRRASDGRVVGNCHKLPQSHFTRSLASVEETVSQMSATIDALLQRRPTLKILLTVSPIRHLRDGAHDNQLSKATLLLAIEQLQRLYPRSTLYFPSYEIMLDELRDYRFYAEDMIHPSTVAADYIWERFGATYFSPATEKLNAEMREIARALDHRPIDASSQAHRTFLSKIMLKIEAIQKKYPYFDFEKEITQCNTQLEK